MSGWGERVGHVGSYTDGLISGRRPSGGGTHDSFFSNCLLVKELNSKWKGSILLINNHPQKPEKQA